MKKQVPVLLAALFLLVMAGSSCKAVKPYQKSKLNDAEMALSARLLQKNEHDFQAIREGSSGANGGKVGGGCGCN